MSITDALSVVVGLGSIGCMGYLVVMGVQHFGEMLRDHLRTRRVAEMTRDFAAAGGLAPEQAHHCPDCGSPRRDTTPKLASPAPPRAPTETDR